VPGDVLADGHAVRDLRRVPRDEGDGLGRLGLEQLARGDRGPGDGDGGGEGDGEDDLAAVLHACLQAKTTGATVAPRPGGPRATGAATLDTRRFGVVTATCPVGVGRRPRWGALPRPPASRSDSDVTERLRDRCRVDGPET